MSIPAQASEPPPVGDGHMAPVARPSRASLYIEMFSNNERLASGTGFIVESGGRAFLITNRHNLSGREYGTNTPKRDDAVTPNAVVIRHHSRTQAGAWIGVREPVVDADREPLWLEHAEHGRLVDVVALPLTITADVRFYPHDPYASPDQATAEAFAGLPSPFGEQLPFRMQLGVTDEVSVVGFPFDLLVGGFLAVWTRGFVASEPSVDFGDLPCFLIDARTRQGQSGSPVLRYEAVNAVPSGKIPIQFPQPIEYLLGVYSGRINSQSDLGRVWKASVVREIIEAGVRNPEGTVDLSWKAG